MAEKITLSELSGLLAENTGFARRDTEAFLKELFFEIAASLERGEVVKVKGLGTFKVQTAGARKSVDVSTGEEIEISAHTRVVFTPDKELAAAVNAPFSMFESVEIADGVTEEMLADDMVPEVLPVPDMEDEPETGTQTEDEKEKEPELNIAEVTASEEYVAENEISAAEPEENYEEKCEEEETSRLPENPRKGLPAWVWFMIGFACACLLFVCFVVAYRFYEDTQSHSVPLEESSGVIDSLPAADTSSPLLEDSAEEILPEENIEAEANTLPSDTPVYDTVTRTRYLTTMSREYYGSYHFWPYIYEENRAILGHPDRIRPGTRVVIPSLSKYGVDSKNPQDVAEAKRRGAAIYARYASGS